MEKMKFIAMLLAFIMMLSTLTSLVALPVLAEGEAEETAATTEGEEGEETEESEETEEETPATSTSTGSTLSQDYANKKYKTNEEKLATMELVHSAYDYELYYHKETGEVQIVNTKTGRYLSTNPYDVANSGNKSTEREKLLSQLIVTYLDAGEEKTMYSYSMAALIDQIKMSKIRGGIRVEYTIGKGSTRRTLPMMIEKSRFEKYILAPLKESGDMSMYNKFKSYYLLKDPSDPKLTANEVQTLYNTLPITKQMAVYVIDPTVANVERELNMFEKLITTYTNYTYDDVLYDHDLTGYTGALKNPAIFRMALEYYVTEEGLEVRLPARGIRYDAKQYSLVNVKILPFFGAYQQKERGYVVIPDGSGTLVRFEDTSPEVATTVASRMYGEDYSFYDQKSIANMEDWILPVYGMVEEKEVKTDEFIYNEDGTIETVTNISYDPQGFFAIITEGDSLSEISTASGGVLNKYFSTSVNVYPRPKDTYPLEGISVSGSTATWTVESDKKYTGNYRIKYFMLDGEESTYVNMANIYRKYLEKKGALTKQENKEDTELFIETFGSVSVSERVLGVPVDVKKPLTSFEDARIMIEDLEKDGITNISIKYTGWANGGLETEAPTRAKVEKAIGGKKGLEELVEFATEKGIKIFPDYDFVYISNFGSGDKFDIKDDTVKTVDDRSAVHRSYSPVFQAFMNDGKLLISPNRLLEFYDMFKEDFAEFKTGAISMSTLGSDLNSDHNEDDSLNREDSKERVREFLSTVKEDGYDILVDAGNSYVLDYATDIVNVALDSSNRYVASEAIPFVGMVFHGYKNFAGTAINLAGDYNNSILKTIENGADLYFMLSYENTSALKTLYGDEKYYSIRYDIWYDDLVETYKIVNKILKPVLNSVITQHVADNRLVDVTYDNGVRYIINYENNNVTVMNGAEIYTVAFDEDTVTTNEGVISIAEFVKN